MTSNSHSFGGGTTNSLSQLAAAAAATNNRNRVLGVHGHQSQNPFVIAAAAAGGGAGGGIYGNYNCGGLQHPQSRGVPIYNEIPGRQRRGGGTGVPTQRGGQLEVAGMVVGSWGANYGAHVGFGGGNPLTTRIPMGQAAAYVNPNIQVSKIREKIRF